MKDYINHLKTAHMILEDNSNWMDFKKIMLRSLPSGMRKKFSTRDPKTKKQRLNEFEMKMIDIYYKETGILLELEEKNG